MQEQKAVSAEEVKPLSFTEKLTNIIASPGELFENVRLTGKNASNWVVPLVLLILVALVLGQLVAHNASLADQIGTIIKKGFEKPVQDGKMTQDQADQYYEQFKPGSMMFTISLVGRTVIFTPIVLFFISFVYWLLGKTAMRATAPYMKVVEVVGLTFFIWVLESIVATFLVFAMDSIYASPGLGAFVSNFSLENKLHLVMGKINVFSIWELIVTGIGLSKLFQRDLPKVLVLVFALWIIWSAFTILTGWFIGM